MEKPAMPIIQIHQNVANPTKWIAEASNYGCDNTWTQPCATLAEAEEWAKKQECSTVHINGVSL